MAINQKAMRILGKLFDMGFDDEKAIASMTMDDILSIKGITVSDIELINSLQKTIKEHKVLAFLNLSNKKEG